MVHVVRLHRHRIRFVRAASSVLPLSVVLNATVASDNSYLTLLGKRYESASNPRLDYWGLEPASRLGLSSPRCPGQQYAPGLPGLQPRLRCSDNASVFINLHLIHKIAVTYMLTGRQNTLPIARWSMLRRQATPEVNAVSTLVIVASVILIVFGTWLSRRGSGEPVAAAKGGRQCCPLSITVLHERVGCGFSWYNMACDAWSKAP